MTDLFGNNISRVRTYRRDSIGRFADEKTSRYEKALKEAAKYKAMYEKERSRARGMATILRLKDELINKLKGGADLNPIHSRPFV